MPRLVRKRTAELLAAANEHLRLATVGLAVIDAASAGAARTAPIAGLVGAAAELALSAILVELGGDRAMMRPGQAGQYLSAAEVHEQAKRLLSPTAAPAFLLDGLKEPGKHRVSLHDAVVNLRALLVARAIGLHGGQGPGVEQARMSAIRVAEFLDLLSRSRRVKPYLGHVPRPAASPVERSVLAEDLFNKAQGTPKGSQLLNLILLLPDFLADEPDWFTTLARAAVRPTKGDVSLLLRSYRSAMPGVVSRTGAGQSALPVRFSPNDPGAIPVRPTAFPRSFSTLREEMEAAIAIANARLEKRELALPPKELVRDLFVAGLENVLGEPGVALGPHQGWPLVAASLAIQGTAGPWWFLVRVVDDRNQLGALLERASTLNSYLRKAMSDVRSVLGIFQKPSSDAAAQMLTRQGVDNRAVAQARVALAQYRDVDDLPPPTRQQLHAAIAGGSMASVMQAMLDATQLSDKDCSRWIRRAAMCCNDKDDAGVLHHVLKDRRAGTDARSAFARIDRRVALEWLSGRP